MIEDDDKEDFNDDQATIVNMDRFVRGRKGWRDGFHKEDKNRCKERQDKDLVNIKMKIPQFQGKNNLDAI